MKLTHEIFQIDETNPEKSRWTKIGVGFLNKDGSITQLLNVAPTPGFKLQIREIKRKVKAAA